MPATVKGTSGSTLENVATVDVNATADGDNTIVAAPGAGLKIKVVSFILTSTAIGTVLLQSANSTKGRLNLGAQGGAVAAPAVDADGDLIPWLECNNNEALVFENAAGQDILGFLSYIVEA